jgi:hypothetical protein
MLRKPKFRSYALAAAAAIGATLFVSSPAHAADICAALDVGGNELGYGCMSPGNHWAYVHDSRADNLGVRILLWDSNGHTWTAGDPNGSASGNGGRHTVGLEHYTAFQVCAGVSGANTYCTVRVGV